MTHCLGGCALQVSALQQGAGVQDGVAQEEGTVELGSKTLWKVGHRELESMGRSSSRQEVRARRA